ncbi:uncharacterized protein N7459_006307 [Penicillium hispanicum]|uniref:uncharacterized protein n=1 Tax=Penicillium hispanicum TaxID=1080232 RepID=UPI002540DC94|nr:uncharacterized protein N7459_006307 [Penicillium hispanicum]KAJ5580322.1 hypothetical protein N7459_006307 [Penicillium hispanicum]
MLALHITLYALLGASLAFAIVELGLSAYVVSYWGGTRKEAYWDPSQGFGYRDVHVGTPGILIFLIFSACWTILVSLAALVLPWFYTRKGFVSATLNTVLGIGFAAVYFVSMVFWLACFADIVYLLHGSTSTSPYLDAIIAFAVLLWVLFLALFILVILALCGVLLSTWAGYQSMRKQKMDSTPPPPPPASEPVHDRDMPTNTNPAAPASELSTRDAEALHNQPPSQSHSVSSPSAVVSAELSGDSVHDHHASHA